MAAVLNARFSEIVFRKLDREAIIFKYSQMAICYQEPLDRTFHALGDGTRRQILAVLANQGPASASELQAPFELSQPTISKHLKVLETAGLVLRQVEGRVHRFSLNPAPLQEVEDWVARHQTFWQGSLSRLERLTQQIKNGEDKL